MTDVAWYGKQVTQTEGLYICIRNKMPVGIIFVLHGQLDGLCEKPIDKFGDPHIKLIVSLTVQYDACPCAVNTDKKVVIVRSAKAQQPVFIRIKVIGIVVSESQDFGSGIPVNLLGPKECGVLGIAVYHDELIIGKSTVQLGGKPRA